MPSRAPRPSGCAHADPTWAERYAKPADEFHVPRGEAARRACAEGGGRDGHALLAATVASNAPAWLRQVPAVALLRRVWVQNFCLRSVGTGTGAGSEADVPVEGGMLVRWRTEAEGFPTSLLMVASPYDPEVHYAKKRATTWIGYKVHLIETCDDERPHLITHVETTPAPVVDRDALQPAHRALAVKELLPGTHLVDAAYVAADQLIASERDHGVTLLGPTPKDQQWQARTEGERLHHPGLHPRLGPTSGHLPGRAREPELDSRPQPGADGDAHPLLDRGPQVLPA